VRNIEQELEGLKDLNNRARKNEKIGMLKPLVSSDNIILFNSKLPFEKKHKNCIGLMDPFREDGVEYVAIWIHPKTSKKCKLNTITHEAIHIAYPSLTEQQTIDGADLISEILWKAGYRKIKKNLNV
jgi:hypothetical protein